MQTRTKCYTLAVLILALAFVLLAVLFWPYGEAARARDAEHMRQGWNTVTESMSRSEVIAIMGQPTAFDFGRQTELGAYELLAWDNQGRVYRFFVKLNGDGLYKLPDMDPKPEGYDRRSRTLLEGPTWLERLFGSD